MLEKTFKITEFQPQNGQNRQIPIRMMRSELLYNTLEVVKFNETRCILGLKTK